MRAACPSTSYWDPPIPPGEQGMFFTLFLGMYLTTVLGNLLIILLIRLDSRLHTPMYFFLSHLAFSDISLSSVTVPKIRQKSSMRPENQSSVSQFLLLGLPIPPGQQGVFFTLFLGMYLTTVLGNLFIILLISVLTIPSSTTSVTSMHS
ncbi:Olfactory receptor 1J2 [Myotis davidii]|uniref:Olfactory receptor 1J2 n=1 Tax=Myotis davidii TaxID=225400 RepID=L5MJD3_MYODS|nr:Olfactory receptor 1J2 [Myotis davidii]